ncbi:hypothetical protein, partial [Nostoc sp. DedQUE09]|uniref:hypothetical protein n=1 Tax=Nostoc sp. DedQUE09 TaxID=3075394 RepID=UPI002AD4A720
MLTVTWQEEIASLKQDLKKEIKKISDNSEINIPNHICINNLKSKLYQLKMKLHIMGRSKLGN